MFIIHFLVRVRRIIRLALLFFLLSSILSVLAYRWLPVHITPLMLIRCAQQMGRGEKVRLRHHWVDMDTGMSPDIALAVVAGEDKRFMTHHGFDIGATCTISQRTVDDVFLWPGDSWLHTGLEAYFTVLVELMWSKHRIMEVYLNTTETGDGVYGVDAVAWRNFGRGADRLTRANCALVAATLPAPLKSDPQNPTPHLLRRQTLIMQQMDHLEQIAW